MSLTSYHAALPRNKLWWVVQVTILARLSHRIYSPDPVLRGIPTLNSYYHNSIIDIFVNSYLNIKSLAKQFNKS